MKNRIFVAAMAAIFIFNVVGFSLNDTGLAVRDRRQATRLVSLLPASDGVAVFDSKRFLSDALPKVLASNEPMLSEVMARVDQMSARTGVDLRKFDQVAVGIAFKRDAGNNLDFDPVAIASGDINAGALVAVGKLASNGTYREEKIAGKTVFVFSPKDVLQKATIKTTNSKISGYVDRALNGLSHDIAVAAIDNNTLVLGSLNRVRETLSASSHVSPDVSSLLSVKETAVMSFALRSPGGISKMLPLENDELGANVDAIQFISGSLEVSTAGASLQLMARTKKQEQAQSLKDTVEGLQMLGKAFLGGAKGADKQVYARMLKNAQLGVRGSDVTLDLIVPQSDIDTLIAGIK